MKVEVAVLVLPVPDTLYGLSGRKPTLRGRGEGGGRMGGRGENQWCTSRSNACKLPFFSDQQSSLTFLCMDSLPFYACGHLSSRKRRKTELIKSVREFPQEWRGTGRAEELFTDLAN